MFKEIHPNIQNCHDTIKKAAKRLRRRPKLYITTCRTCQAANMCEKYTFFETNLKFFQKK